MIPLKNKEQVLYYLLAHPFNFSRYDLKFFSTLQTIIYGKKKITSSQADLFDYLLSKYNKQLLKSGFESALLKELPWKVQVVTSNPEYSAARVELIDNHLRLKVPFNRTFISEIQHEGKELFQWNSVDHGYYAVFSSHSLKILKDLLPIFFGSIVYSPNLVAVLKELAYYDAAVWEPTLVQVNGNLMIGATNETLDRVTSCIPLDLEFSTILKLSAHGIKIDNNLIKDYPKLKFAAEFNTEVDIDSFDQVIDWMVEVNAVIIMADSLFQKGSRNSNASTVGRNSRSYRTEIIHKLQKSNLVVNTVSHTAKTAADFIKAARDSNRPNILIRAYADRLSNRISNPGGYRISKQVTIKDARPVVVS